MTVDAPLDPLAAHLSAAGPAARRLRRVLALLAGDWHPLAELIRRPAAPRRSVEELLALLGPDLESQGDRHRIRPARAAAYRSAFELDEIPGPADPLADAVSQHTAALSTIRADIDANPPPLPALDHVPATPESVLRRALWLERTYDLSGAQVLCLGDHDLTSLALAAVRPDLQITVVDLDERLLAHIDATARARGHRIRCLHADLRFGFPPSATGWADLVFTDPPYTPEGIGLFATRAVESLRDPATGRIHLAYGFSERSPALGWKVQQELLKLGLVFEALLPDFDRYLGAQAVGSASSLYVCRPTAKAKKTVASTGIYTHGPQSIEAGTTDRIGPLRELAAKDGLEVVVRQPGWAAPVTARGAVALDTTADPGPWALRHLLAISADRVLLLVDNNHPDITSERGQRGLADLVASKYKLRFLRSNPDPKSAVIVADRIDETPESQQIQRALVDRAHGKPGNIWREALTRTGLTKNEARARITELLPDLDLSARLIDLPRHQLAELFTALGAEVLTDR
ncbi:MULTISPECIES: bis-aminopropyl spermidine synthase family protein [unclassified Crossiella]|uniref:bis-aminopropyl spermidine synthase family protein n=1 Tax=unclassified Crossiella TaxID=2620835 RepID=UPI001FFF41B5|nr:MULTISPECIES: bis-aminopropyl spermidine synthase family protein [unclassified Crossiella]MCK2243941.1 bis-aminopropyl spermidine synthase family protein [Crossiella sp. S99.2]MCK2257201.1 bis-aminopropyl spermidine synthase family protein [Crossiella sp. S99.1]